MSNIPAWHANVRLAASKMNEYKVIFARDEGIVVRKMLKGSNHREGPKIGQKGTCDISYVLPKCLYIFLKVLSYNFFGIY